MKYEPEQELRVLWIVKELGLASIEEVQDHYKTLFNADCANCNLIMRRWKARKAFTIEDSRYKIADIPPWFRSLRMDQLIQLNKTEVKDHLKELLDMFTGGIPVGGPKKGMYSDFEAYDFTFENLDPIMGGTPTKLEENGKTVFPRDSEGKLVVQRNWIYGLIRDNQAMVNSAGLQYHVGIGKGYWEDGIETITLAAPVIVNRQGVGISHYEAIPAGKHFTVKMRWPTKGTEINTLDKIQDMFDIIAETPIRGLGANNRAYGGRVKLIELRTSKEAN